MIVLCARKLQQLLVIRYVYLGDTWTVTAHCVRHNVNEWSFGMLPNDHLIDSVKRCDPELC